MDYLHGEPQSAPRRTASRTIWLVVVATLYFVVLFAGIVEGSSTETTDCSSSACMKSITWSPLRTGLGIGVLLGLVFLGPRSGRVVSSQPVAVSARFWAFMLDGMMLVLILTPAFDLFVILAEGFRTGSFSTVVQPEPDQYNYLGATFALSLLLLSLRSTTIGSQTFGQRIMGYQSVPASNPLPSALVNSMLGLVALCAWPVSLMLATGSRPQPAWWNRISGVQAVGTD